MVKYRVYSSYKMLHIVGKVDSVEEVIQLIDEVIYKEDAHYLVVKEDYENNTDIPFMSIWSIEEFEEIKNNYFEEQKQKGKEFKNGKNKY